MAREQASLPIAVDLPADDAGLRIFTDCASRLVPQEIALAECGPLLVRATVVVPQKGRIYLALLECLVAVDEWSLSQWHFPPLYESGVRYEMEPAGNEVWQSTPALYLRGRGDCEDLTAHLVAELRHQNDHAAPNMVLAGRAPFGGRLFHFNVKRQNGKIEDPSRALGME